jgi:hypothetical protein
MPKMPEVCRVHERLRALIELALSEGWIVCEDEEGMRLVKPGLPPIFICATALLCRATPGNGREDHGC